MYDTQDMLGQWAPRERASTAPDAGGGGGGGGGSERFRRRSSLLAGGGGRGRGGSSLRTTVTEEVTEAGEAGADQQGGAGPEDSARAGPCRSASPTGRLGRRQQPRPPSRVPNHPSFLTGAEKRAHLEAVKADQAGRPVWRPGGSELIGWSGVRLRDG